MPTTEAMSLAAVIARIADIDQGALAPGAAVPAAATPDASAPTTAATTGTTSPTFASALAGQTTSLSTLGGGSTAGTLSALGLSTPATSALSAYGTTAGTTVGQRIVAAAQAEVGQAEQPPGSNDSPRIAQYRQATAGSGVGPWCAYFASWASAQAGAPLGEAGQGFGSVSALAGWAQRTGRSEPVGAGYTPRPGDLVVWGGEHVGIVESVDPNGTLHTIEGNSSNAVTRRTHSATGDGATSFIRV